MLVKGDEVKAYRLNCSLTEWSQRKHLYLSTRGALSRWNIKQVEDGRLCSTGRQLHLPLGGQTGICPHRWRCQLPDLGLPLSHWCPQGNRLRTYRGSAHLQERYDDVISPYWFYIRRNVSLNLSVYCPYSCIPNQVKSIVFVYPIDIYKDGRRVSIFFHCTIIKTK